MDYRTNVAVGNDNEDAVFYVGQEPGREGYLLWQYDSDPSLGYYSIGTFNGANNMVLQEYGGNVGVRTSNPMALFHVAENSPGYTGLFGSPISDWSSSTNLSIGDSDGPSVLYIGQSESNKGYLYWNYNSVASDAYLALGSYFGSNPLVFQQSGGNVGIGTITPSSRLEIDFDNYGKSYLGYSSLVTNYIDHLEIQPKAMGRLGYMLLGRGMCKMMVQDTHIMVAILP
ncbi:MAG: hypothetical protein IPH84_16040 [Bacteroidales bacterium]|nr:hypothetical protein [Bacteroidales bacterium]